MSKEDFDKQLEKEVEYASRAVDDIFKAFPESYQYRSSVMGFIVQFMIEKESEAAEKEVEEAMEKAMKRKIREMMQHADLWN